MERPLVGKYRRGFLFVSVAAFLFWVALIYVFNRDVVVVDDMDGISTVAARDPDDANTKAGEDSVRRDAIEKSVENIRRAFGSDGAGYQEEEVQQTQTNTTAVLGNDLNEEPVDSAEPHDGKQSMDGEADQQPLRNNTESDEPAVNSTTTMDKEDRQPPGNENDGAIVDEPISLDTDLCEGRYVFVQILPRRFHVDLLRNCKSLSAWTDMCETLSNAGLGPELPANEKALTKTGWFSTNQFSLEVIFHNRMKQYKCLTNDSSVASAIYVPYYAGLDVAQYLWHSTEYRDTGPKELVKWLRARPEWKRMRGSDHFLVAGRISWDFRRETSNDSDWGTNLLVLPEVKRMTSLVLESTLIPAATDFAIPYPTYFHPSSDAQVIHWQDRMKRLRRPYLFSFAGARRPNLPSSIRDEIIDQCRAAKSKCKLLECYSRGNTCYRPVNLIRLFQESIFCLQPQGDSYTRRSTFDSILTGCVPVFFHSGSAYDQYKWHLPADHARYSVFIPEGEVKKGKVSIERVLSEIPRWKVEEMQWEVIDLIPKILYADPRSELETFEDAFDLTVKGVIERINTIRRAG